MDSKLSSETSTGKSASYHALFNIIKVFVGIGVLTGPSAMSHAGVVLAVLGVTFAGLLSLYSINIQAQTRHKLQNEYNLQYLRSNEQSTDDSDPSERDPLARGNDLDNSTVSEAQPMMRINNYSDLGRAAYGETGFVIVSICLFLQQMCSVTAYFSFIHNYIPIGVALCIIVPF